jgi:hypothetical protein
MPISEATSKLTPLSEIADTILAEWDIWYNLSSVLRCCILESVNSKVYIVQLAASRLQHMDKQPLSMATLIKHVITCQIKYSDIIEHGQHSALLTLSLQYSMLSMDEKWKKWDKKIKVV